MGKDTASNVKNKHLDLEKIFVMQVIVKALTCKALLPIDKTTQWRNK